MLLFEHFPRYYTLKGGGGKLLFLFLFFSFYCLKMKLKKVPHGVLKYKGQKAILSMSKHKQICQSDGFPNFMNILLNKHKTHTKLCLTNKQCVFKKRFNAEINHPASKHSAIILLERADLYGIHVW